MQKKYPSYNQLPQKQYNSYVNFKKQFQNLLSNQKIQYLKKLYPHAILGKNIDQKIVILDMIGAIKPHELSKIIDDDALIGYIFQRLIYLNDYLLHSKNKVIWILDLSGKIMQLATQKVYSWLQKIIFYAQKYFPQLLYRLYFINTPMLFDAVWNKLAQKIDQRTLNKIIILTDDINQMITQVDLTLLPKCIGGCVPDQILYKVQNLNQFNGNNNQKNVKDQEEKQLSQIDINSIKMALSGMKFKMSHSTVATTPLNTQSDEGSYT